jgi:hypothetical protein
MRIEPWEWELSPENGKPALRMTIEPWEWGSSPDNENQTMENTFRKKIGLGSNFQPAYVWYHFHFEAFSMACAGPGNRKLGCCRRYNSLLLWSCPRVETTTGTKSERPAKQTNPLRYASIRVCGKSGINGVLGFVRKSNFDTWNSLNGRFLCDLIRFTGRLCDYSGNYPVSGSITRVTTPPTYRNSIVKVDFIWRQCTKCGGRRFIHAIYSAWAVSWVIFKRQIVPYAFPRFPQVPPGSQILSSPIEEAACTSISVFKFHTGELR